MSQLYENWLGFSGETTQTGLLLIGVVQLIDITWLVECFNIPSFVGKWYVYLSHILWKNLISQRALMCKRLSSPYSVLFSDDTYNGNFHLKSKMNHIFLFWHTNPKWHRSARRTYLTKKCRYFQVWISYLKDCLVLGSKNLPSPKSPCSVIKHWNR